MTKKSKESEERKSVVLTAFKPRTCESLFFGKGTSAIEPLPSKEYYKLSKSKDNKKED